MTYPMMHKASSLYRQTSASGGVETADRHQLISMLLDGLLERINRARGQIEHHDMQGKGQSFSRAIAILTELRACLNHDIDPDFTGRIDALYDYITRRLLHAQLNDDLATLDECRDLVTPIRDGWLDIRQSYLADGVPA